MQTKVFLYVFIYMYICIYTYGLTWLEIMKAFDPNRLIYRPLTVYSFVTFVVLVFVTLVHVSVALRIQNSPHLPLYIHTYIYIYIYICTGVYMYLHMHFNIYIHLYTYKDTYIKVYTYSYILPIDIAARSRLCTFWGGEIAYKFTCTYMYKYI
jgi:hypothetical protein